MIQRRYGMVFSALLWVWLVGVVSPTMSAASDVGDPRIAALLARQHAYFQQISSLQFEAKIVVRFGAPSKEAGVPVDSAESEFSFVCAGPKYRAQSVSLNAATGKKTSHTMAYNGEKYQHLNEAGEKAWLTVTQDRDKLRRDPYGAMHPVLTPFAWAFLPGDEVSVAQ
ncbi:MAG: hypothetical protein GTO63_07150, partial [Anaerolineae bacterium]|nr:hypothetical protein [Anaerolineae bacterium]NIQ77771.1 hypothetical protein [Anaerolineae bacterium]